ncbi:MAG: DUF1828 domain-containing protein [Chloroflexi bacterium]|nr:DUF1828 domain-containing protein [Chloroflexota bacterium]
MTLCSDLITGVAQHLSVNSACGEVRAGGQEIFVSPFLYPDRDNIELFLRETQDGKVMISDMGQTMTKLSSYGFVPGNAARRRAMIFQITASLDVRYENGHVLVVASHAEAGQRAWDVLLAIQRLSDLVFTVPAYTKATFSDEFENYMVQKRADYKRGVPIRLATDFQFTADFVVGERKIVQLLSASSTGYARERIDRVHTIFAEMEYADDDRERIAVLDDRQPVWSDNVIIPLRHRATRILGWTQKAELERTLITAA